MGRTIDYAEFRVGLSELEYLDNLYVELRGADGKESVSGIFDIYETDAADISIEDFKVSVSSRVKSRESFLSKLRSEHDVYRVLCDWSNADFYVEDEPGEYKVSSEAAYGAAISKLPGTVLKGRSPKPPRYPDSMSKYSVWHYTLDWACKCRDIDYLEIRYGKPVALLEVTGRLKDERHLKNSLPMIKKRLELQRRMMMIIGESLDVAAFVVIHTDDLETFYVFNSRWKLVMQGSRERYIEWLSSL